MLDSLLTSLRSDNFAALRGSMVTGLLPVRENILNEFLTALRQERDLPTKRLEMRLKAGNQFTLFLQPQIGFLTPQIKLDFEVTSEVDFEADGRLTLRSLGMLGAPTAQLIRTVILQSTKLPGDCVIVEGNVIHIALREALRSLDADIARMLGSLHLSIRSGILYIIFSVIV